MSPKGRIIIGWWDYICNYSDDPDWDISLTGAVAFKKVSRVCKGKFITISIVFWVQRHKFTWLLDLWVKQGWKSALVNRYCCVEKISTINKRYAGDNRLIVFGCKSWNCLAPRCRLIATANIEYSNGTAVRSLMRYMSWV